MSDGEAVWLVLASVAVTTLFFISMRLGQILLALQTIAKNQDDEHRARRYERLFTPSTENTEDTDL